jgi:hypothetical protein
MARGVRTSVDCVRTGISVIKPAVTVRMDVSFTSADLAVTVMS